MLDVGWDHRVLIVDDEVVFRFPRTEPYARRIEVDRRLLGALREWLPIPMPDPMFSSEDPPFMGYGRLPGGELEEAELARSPRESERLGRFLDALHRFPVGDAIQLGLQADTAVTWRSHWMEAWDRYRTAGQLLGDTARRVAEKRWEAFLGDDSNFDFEPALIHADLTPQHVLWENGMIRGVIDWSDAQIGDVAMDFAWPLSLPHGAAKLILAPYSARCTRGLYERARFYEWTGWWSDAIHGLETADASYVERGVAGILRQIL